MTIQLSDHFTYRRLLRFVVPSVWMMVILSIYYVVDGFFVSNFIGKIPFAAINLLTPAVVIPSSLAFMLSAGGAAVIGKTLGEGRSKDGKRYFSMIIYVVLCSGILITLASEWVLPYFLIAMEAEGELFEACLLYGRIDLAGLVPFMMQVMFQALWSVAERPKYGLYLTIASGVVNLVFDYIFIVFCGYGIAGAAVASVMGQILGGVTPLVYFCCHNTSTLRLVRTAVEWPIVRQACSNGFSEMLTSLSASVLGILYNLQLMDYLGADGIAAYGVMLYANGIFESIYFGYAMGVSPLISYHFGAQNSGEVRNLFYKSLAVIGVSGMVLTFFASFFAADISRCFVGYDPELWKMTEKAFSIYALSFLFLGFNTFGSSFFTALNNGRVSAVISLLRILVFQSGAVLLLPLFFGVGGIWWSVVIAEMSALAFVVLCWRRYRRQYGY